MAENKETRILKSNSIEEFRQKSNEISLGLGDKSLLATDLADKIFTHTASAGDYLVSPTNTRFEYKKEETVDNTGGYILLTGSPTVGAGFAAGASVTQSGGYSATIVSASTTKILVKNSSGTFSSSSTLTAGSSTIAGSAIRSLVAESYKKAELIVKVGSTVYTQDATSTTGFHVPNHAGSVTLTGGPDVSDFEEGAVAYQGTNLANATWQGTILDCSATLLRTKTISGTFSASTQIKVDGGTDTISGSNHGAITNEDQTFGRLIEFNTPLAAGNAVQIISTNLVDAINEVQDDVGTIASLAAGISDRSDLVTATNSLKTEIGTASLDTSATTLRGAVNELHTEIVSNDTDIATNATNIGSAQTAITSLQGTVNTISGDYATGTAFNTLTNTVNAIDVLATFAQDDAPNSGMGTGDIWLDTNDDNKLYRWSGSAWVPLQPGAAALSANSTAITSLENALQGFTGSGAVSTAVTGLQNSVSNNAGNITANADSITALESTVDNGTTGVAATASALSNLQTSVSSIPVQFFQANAPSSGHVTGDYWIDSDDNKLYRYNGSAWIAIRDSLLTSTASALSQLQTTVGDNTADISTNATAISDEVQARATAVSQVSAVTNAKNQTFVGTSAPTAIAAGDLWIDTDDNNKLYRATAAGTSNWVAVRDNSNDTKATIFAQSNQPTALAVGDIWIETDNDDKVYRWSGSAWTPVGIPTQASVTTLSSAVTDIEGNAAASYVLQVNANGAVAGMVIEANATDSEGDTGNRNFDYLSNGFKVRNTSSEMNTNNATYIFMAFAESPFQTANAK